MDREKDEVAALIRSAADRIEPGPAPVHQIVRMGQRRILRIRATGAVAGVVVVAAGLMTAAQLGDGNSSPDTAAPPTTTSVEPDQRVIDAVRAVGRKQRDGKPTRIQYVTASYADVKAFIRADRGLEPQPSPGPAPSSPAPGDPVIFAVASGNFTKVMRAPVGVDLPKYSALAVILEPQTASRIQFGALYTHDSYNLQDYGFGPVTDCRLTYDGDQVSPVCTQTG